MQLYADLTPHCKLAPVDSWYFALQHRLAVYTRSQFITAEVGSREISNFSSQEKPVRFVCPTTTVFAFSSIKQWF